jgi:uncharacterized membrane protein
VDTPFVPEPVPLPEPAAGQPQFAADPPAAAEPPAYRDRSTGLIVFGIIQIVLGLMAALFIPFMVLAVLLTRHSGAGRVPLGNYLTSVATYGAVAVLGIVLGVGSIRARRWAWALTLVLSWIWLVTGVLMTVTMTAVLPTSFLAGMRAAQANSGNAAPMPAGVMAVILTFMIAVATVFLVVLPIIFVAYYRRKDVEETCRRRDPVERWTDRCPLPVLSASLPFAFGAVFFLATSFTTPLFPFFGRYLTGVRAAAVMIPLGILYGFLAYFIYRVRITAWWIAMAAIVLRLSSAAATFVRADLLEAYAKLGWSNEQLQVMSANPVIRSRVFLWWSLAFSVIFLGYMIWIRRYFKPPGAAAEAAPSGPSFPEPVA